MTDKNFDYLLDQLKKRISKGEKQIDIAREIGMSQSHLNEILSGKCSISKIALDTAMRMFPQNIVIVDGNAQNIANFVNIGDSSTFSQNVSQTQASALKTVFSDIRRIFRNLQNALVQIPDIPSEQRSRILELLMSASNDLSDRMECSGE